jgi:hypothetical protein
MKIQTSIIALALSAAFAATAGAAEATRSFQQAFPAGGEVRLANLAGRVEIVRGQGRDLVVNAPVHGDFDDASETQRVLQNMKWVKSQDRKGRPEWALAYPVEKHRSYSYPVSRKDDDSLPSWLSFLSVGSGTMTTYRGERVRIYTTRRSSVPVLYADLRIALPAGANAALRNAVGPVRGGDLEGTLLIDTGSGKVEVASHTGQLTVDTGSGDVILGAVKGETSVDTGSGDVVVRRLVGNGSVDTGSGNVDIQEVSAGRLTIDTGSGDVTLRNGVAGKVVADTGSGGIKVVAVELDDLSAETGSGNIVVQSSLANTKRVMAETGSGDVDINAGPNASFDIASDQGSGELIVGYADAVLRKSGRKVVGAKRGSGNTVIRVETGSGDCTIRPKG